MTDHFDHLRLAILALTREVRLVRVLIDDGGFQATHRLATKHDLDQAERHIMSAISDFLDKQTSFNQRVSDGIDSAVASIAAVTDDIQTLNDKITELQNSTGAVTPEDQARIDALETQGDALATKVESVKTALAALDALTPPKAPPATP